MRGAKSERTGDKHYLVNLHQETAVMYCVGDTYATINQFEVRNLVREIRNVTGLLVFLLMTLL